MMPMLEVNFNHLLPKDKEAHILDIGCGMGHFLHLLKTKGYKKFFGIDVGIEQIDYCRKNVTDRVQLIDDLTGYLKSRTEEYDFIMFKSVIAHLPHEEIVDALSAMHKSLKPGGRLIVEEFNASAWIGNFMLYNDFTHYCAFTENSLRQVLLLAGFTKINIGPNRYVVKKPTQFMAFLIRTIWQVILRCIYIAERGMGSNPHILSKLIIAVAEK